MTRRTIRTAAAVLLACGVAAPLVLAAPEVAERENPTEKTEKPAAPNKSDKPAAPKTAAPKKTPAVVPADFAPKLYDRVAPSLVAVKYTWESELGRRDLTGAAVVVDADGLVMTTIGLVPNVIPDAQVKDFKVVIPSQEKDPEELEATFEGRDERTNLAFVKVKDKTKHTWKPLKFEEAAVRVGEPVVSIGLLPEAAAYKPYLMESKVAVTLRGDVPQVLVQGGGLAAVGSPVFNLQGVAVGIVGMQTGQNAILNDEANVLAAITSPPKFYTPARDFLQSLQDPPLADKPLKLPWIGIPQMTGLNKDVSEVYNLTDQPAVQVGDVIPNTPAAEAGLKAGNVIVKMNGEALERGDEASELPAILRRKLLRMKVGDEVTFAVIRKAGKPPEDVKVKLAEQPEQPNTAKRYFAEDLGFSVRDLVFIDRYARKLPGDAPGVVVALTRHQGPAESGGLRGNGTFRSDVIIQLNGQPVKDVEEFQKDYQQVRKDKPKDPVVLVVRRDGREDTVRLEPPQ